MSRQLLGVMVAVIVLVAALIPSVGAHKSDGLSQIQIGPTPTPTVPVTPTVTPTPNVFSDDGTSYTDDFFGWSVNWERGDWTAKQSRRFSYPELSLHRGETQVTISSIDTFVFDNRDFGRVNLGEPASCVGDQQVDGWTIAQDASGQDLYFNDNVRSWAVMTFGDGVQYIECRVLIPYGLMLVVDAISTIDAYNDVSDKISALVDSIQTPANMECAIALGGSYFLPGEIVAVSAGSADTFDSLDAETVRAILDQGDRMIVAEGGGTSSSGEDLLHVFTFNLEYGDSSVFYVSADSVQAEDAILDPSCVRDPEDLVNGPLVSSASPIDDPSPAEDEATAPSRSPVPTRPVGAPPTQTPMAGVVSEASDSAATSYVGWVFYAAKSDSQWDLWVHDPKSGDDVQLTDTSGDEWAPVAYRSADTLYFLSEEDGTTQIWSMNPNDWSSRQQISHYTGGGEITYFHVGPATQSIIVTVADQQAGEAQLMELRLDDGSMVPYADAWRSLPTFTPAGSMIYVARNDTETDIVIDREDGTTSYLAATIYDEDNPALSPDGTRLAYNLVNGASNLRQIVILDLDSGEALFLPHRGDDSNPVWSPDGSQIAFVSNDGTSETIWLLASDGSSEAEPLGIPSFDQVWYLDWPA